MAANDELLNQLRAIFAVEAQEHLQAIGQHLVELERQPEASQEDRLLAEIFRRAHNLKGAARAVNYADVETLAHRMESLFDRVRGRQLQLEPRMVDLVLQAVDAIGALTRESGPGEGPGPDVAALAASLDAMVQGSAPVQPATAAVAVQPATAATSVESASGADEGPGRGSQPMPMVRASPSPVPDPDIALVPRAPDLPPVRDVPRVPDAPRTPDPSRGSESTLRLADDTVRVATAKLDTLMARVSELQVTRIAAEPRLVKMQALLESVDAWEAEWRKTRPLHRRLAAALGQKAAPGGRTEWRHELALRGNSRREIGALLEFVAANQARLQAARAQLMELHRAIASDSHRMAQVAADLEDDVRRMRLQPVSTVFDAFPRMVRDLARARGKEVRLILAGADTEVDRSVVEQIKDPLVHLLRNSIDHGIELPAERLKVGKPREGTITLSACQRGGSILIEVWDDGAGIDLTRVRSSAVKKGLLPAEAAGTLGDREALGLIFRSGFSTAPIITDLSGRGVGLDVVRDHIERLHGIIDVENQPGRGVRFSFTLPLTVATTLCLLVQAGGRTFGLPLTNVVRIVRLVEGDIGWADSREVAVVDGCPVILTRLSEVLDLKEKPGDKPDLAASTLPAILLGSAEKRVAFLVDALVGTQEVLIKNLPPPLVRVRHAAGATILGTGEVVVIVNVADLLRSTSRTRARPMAALAEGKTESKQPVILVADDSMTTRTLEKNILEAAGYQVRVAADGVEAWNLLHDEGCDLVVSDIEMPRADGFELVARIRADSRFKELPVILVTSRDSRADRERGIEVGADAYIVKGAFDQDHLLETVRRLV